MRERQITPTTLLTMSVTDVIKVMSDRVLNDIPEGINGEEEIKKLEMLLGRLPNDYAYVIEMLGYARTYVRHFKREGMRLEYESTMDKRDALDSIANALKLQYQGVSRMITIYEQRREEVDMHEYRKDNSRSK